MEWDYKNNLGSGCSPESVTISSNKIFWWKCPREHSWKSTVNNRSRGKGCPYCAGQKVCYDNCLATINPALAAEWNYAKNSDKFTPETVTHNSGKSVWWQCLLGHEWRALINDRANGRGCPYCVGKKVCADNCLATVNPQLAAEWHPTRDGVGLTPGGVTAGSHKSVWWVCEKGHWWKAAIYNRVAGRGCPYCVGQLVCSDNCLATINPQLAAEWHPTRNGVGLTPEFFTRNSGKRAYWLCTSGHEWCATIDNRASGTGCPYCVRSAVSKVSQQWLDLLGVSEENREILLKLPGEERSIRVDAFDPTTNTVYEFLGDFWHGNPDVFDSKSRNPINKRTFGSLYNRTMRRLAKISGAGYNLLFIWEKDFNSQKRYNYAWS